MKKYNIWLCSSHAVSWLLVKLQLYAHTHVYFIYWKALKKFSIHLLGSMWIWNGAAGCGGQYGSAPQKSSIKLPYDLVIPLVGRDPKELKAGACTHICTPVCTKALFTIAERLKQHKFVDGWRGNQMWHLYTMEQYLVLRNGIPICASTQMNFANSILSQTSQTQKNRYCLVLFI